MKQKIFPFPFPLRHAYLEDLKFALSMGEREFEITMSESYFLEFKRAEEIKSTNPSFPMAKLTALGHVDL